MREKLLTLDNVDLVPMRRISVLPLYNFILRKQEVREEFHVIFNVNQQL